MPPKVPEGSLGPMVLFFSECGKYHAGAQYLPFCFVGASEVLEGFLEDLVSGEIEEVVCCMELLGFLWSAGTCNWNNGILSDWNRASL